MKKAGFLLFATLIFSGLTGCGGSSLATSGDNSQEFDNSSSPDPITDNSPPTNTSDGQPEQPANALPNQVISDAADQIEALSIQNSLIAPATAIDLDSAANSLHSIPQYSYLSDFPVSTNIGLLHAGMRVTGLTPLNTYQFSVTGTAEQALFVFNISENDQVVSPVCMDNLSCAGTISNGTALVVLVAANSTSDKRTFTIEESSTRAVFNEGTAVAPFELTGPLPLTHSGAVGQISTLNQTLVAGQSYYRLTGLVVGDRYRLSIANQQYGDAHADFTETTNLYCDPSFSAANSCQFVANQEQIIFTVKGNNAIFGDAFDVVFEYLAPHNLFDGTWHSPYVISTSEIHTVRHLAIADHNAASYYRLNDLDPTIDYRIFATGKTDGISLSVFDPNTGSAIYSPNCNALADENNQRSTDEMCSVTGSTEAYLRAEATGLNSPNSAYGIAAASEALLSIVPGVTNQGSVTDPITLIAEDSVATSFDIHIKNRSIYEVGNLPTNRALLFSIAGATSVTSLSPIDNTGNPLLCESSGHNFCIFTPTQSAQLISITADEVTGGQRLKLTIAPPPDNQSINLLSAQLPYRASVGNWYSNYTINALDPDTPYLVEASNATASLEIAAWPGDATEINCIANTQNSLTTGCAVEADNTGSINFRVSTRNALPGAFFTVDAIPALPLSQEFTSTDTPLIVPDNNAAGVTSTIDVQNVNLIEDISINLLLDHGYSQDVQVTLISPQGHRVILADHLAQSLNTHTVFSDLAARDSSNTQASRYRRSFRPVEPLHPLRNINANGQWRLQVADDRYSNISSALGGTLISWGISFTTIDETGYPEQ